MNISRARLAPCREEFSRPRRELRPPLQDDQEQADTSRTRHWLSAKPYRSPVSRTSRQTSRAAGEHFSAEWFPPIPMARWRLRSFDAHGHLVQLDGGHADADGDGLAVFAAGADAFVELEIVAHHRHVLQRLGTVAYQRGVADR